MVFYYVKCFFAMGISYLVNETIYITTLFHAYEIFLLLLPHLVNKHTHTDEYKVLPLDRALNIIKFVWQFLLCCYLNISLMGAIFKFFLIW